MPRGMAHKNLDTSSVWDLAPQAEARKYEQKTEVALNMEWTSNQLSHTMSISEKWKQQKCTFPFQLTSRQTGDSLQCMHSPI